MTAEPTIRDRVWSAALQLVADDRRKAPTTDEIIEEAGLTDTQRATTQRTLHAMADLGWLNHSDGHHDWSRGDNFKMHRIEYRL
jgi:DNA-binding IclR family transcriptional regulator